LQILSNIFWCFSSTFSYCRRVLVIVAQRVPWWPAPSEKLNFPINSFLQLYSENSWNVSFQTSSLQREFKIHVDFVLWMSESSYKTNLLDSVIVYYVRKKKQKFQNQYKHLVIYSFYRKLQVLKIGTIFFCLQEKKITQATGIKSLQFLPTHRDSVL
jgi:hypothetical protein